MSFSLGARNVELLRQDGTVAPAEELAKKKYILLYFSAHWCPPCRSFTPQLKAFYEQHSAKLNFEVIFISRDKTAEEMQSYFHDAHGPWLCMSYPDVQEVFPSLKAQYRLFYIPYLVVLENTEQRPVVTYYGRDMVDRDPAALQFPWANADADFASARRVLLLKVAAAVTAVVSAFFYIRWSRKG